MKKIIFAALLSLTAIFVIASCSSEAVKTDYQTKINALISNYVDSSEAVSSQTNLSPESRILTSNTNYIYVNTSDTDKIVVTINGKSQKTLSYIFTSDTSAVSKFTWNVNCPKVDVPMGYLSAFKSNFEGDVVNALSYSSLKEAEAYIGYLMKNSSSKSALKSSLDGAKSLYGAAVKKSASVLANLSSDSDLIVKGLEGSKDSKKLAACTSALDLCYDYFSNVANEDYTPTKGDQLVVELALSYVGGIIDGSANGYADAFVQSITIPGKKVSEILGSNVDYAILRAQYLDVITGLNIAQYVAAVLDKTI